VELLIWPCSQYEPDRAKQLGSVNPDLDKAADRIDVNSLWAAKDHIAVR